MAFFIFVGGFIAFIGIAAMVVETLNLIDLLNDK